MKMSANMALALITALLCTTSIRANALRDSSGLWNEFLQSDSGRNKRNDEIHDADFDGLKKLSNPQSTIVSRASRRLGDSTTDSNMICVAGTQNGGQSRLHETTVNFWYGVETNSSDASDFLLALEEEIFSVVTPQLLWCYFATNASDMSKNRILGTKETSDGQLALEEARRLARRLGIVSFSSGPQDVVTSFACPFNFTSQNCFLLNGLMTILAHTTDSLDYIISSILKAIETSMDENLLLSPTQLPTVSRVVYLGPNETEAISGAFLNGGGEAGGNATNGTKVVIGGIEGSGAGSNGRGYRKLPLIAIPIFGVVVVLLFLLRQRKSASMRGLLSEEDDTDDGYVLIGTGDPPGSFHHGQYHYMPDGTHYFSTSCDACYGARRQGAYIYSERDLPTIMEDEVYNDDGFLASSDEYGESLRTLVTADSKDLGAKHSGHNVHQCRSAICEVCLAAEKGGEVLFVPTSTRHRNPNALSRFCSEIPESEPDSTNSAGTIEGSNDDYELALFEIYRDSMDGGEA